MRILRAARAACVAAVAVGLAGCAPRAGVRLISDETWFVTRQRSALNSSRVSERTETLLRRAGPLEQHERTPLDAITTLDADLTRALADGSAPLAEVAALSELCYHAAKGYAPANAAGARLSTSAALLAHACLFHPRLAPGLNALDPRFRMLVDVYNHSIARLVMFAEA
jgi:hypothetical protein